MEGSVPSKAPASPQKKKRGGKEKRESSLITFATKLNVLGNGGINIVREISTPFSGRSSGYPMVIRLQSTKRERETHAYVHYRNIVHELCFWWVCIDWILFVDN